MLPSAAFQDSDSVSDQLTLDPPDADSRACSHAGTRRRITGVFVLVIGFMAKACLLKRQGSSRFALRLIEWHKLSAEHLTMDCSTLFPAGVSLVIADEAMWSIPSRDEEESLIVNAIEKRQREFRAGRHAAHAALDRLGAPDMPILQGEKRNPIWPAGFIGSIAHCRDLCLSVCAVEGEIAGVGVDVEPLDPLPTGVDRHIHTQEEARFMQRQPAGFPERLVFSAKESLYKCYYPLVKRYFGFQSVNLTIDMERRHFGFSPMPECKIEFPAELTFCGRYLWDDTHLYTACYLLRA